MEKFVALALAAPLCLSSGGGIAAAGCEETPTNSPSPQLSYTPLCNGKTSPDESVKQKPDGPASYTGSSMKARSTYVPGAKNWLHVFEVGSKAAEVWQSAMQNNTMHDNYRVLESEGRIHVVPRTWRGFGMHPLNPSQLDNATRYQYEWAQVADGVWVFDCPRLSSKFAHTKFSEAEAVHTVGKLIDALRLLHRHKVMHGGLNSHTAWWKQDEQLDDKISRRCICLLPCKKTRKLSDNPDQAWNEIVEDCRQLKTLAHEIFKRTEWGANKAESEWVARIDPGKLKQGTIKFTFGRMLDGEISAAGREVKYMKKEKPDVSQSQNGVMSALSRLRSTWA